MIKRRFRATEARSPVSCWSRHSFWIYAILALSFQLTGRSALAEDALDRQITLSIPANTRLEDALIEWGIKSELIVMINTPTVDRQTTRGVSGTMSARSALVDLLRGSGLSYTEENGRIRVIPATTSLRSVQQAEQSELASASAITDTQVTATNESTARKKIKDGSAVENIRDNARQTDLGEILVTAQKREERAFDVPISIVALGADTIEKQKISGIDDLAMAVPGLSILESGGPYRQIYLRGVGNDSGNSSLVGLYLDEASVTPALAIVQPDLRTYDMERIEVLRGPQGTLYGEGSLGGTIRFITNKPALNQFAVTANVTSLFTEDGAPSQKIESAINLPIIVDTFALRIASTFDHEGGWINQPAADRTDINAQDLTDVRIEGLWKPADQLAVNVMAVIHRNEGGLNMGEDSNGNYTQTFNLTTTPHVKDNYDLYNVTATYDFPGVRLLSTTSYMDQNKVITDMGYIFPDTPPPSYEALYEPLIVVNSKYVTQEARLSSNDSGPWQWTFGGSYRHVQLLDDLPSYYAGPPTIPGTPLPAPYSFEYTNPSHSLAAFGDASYKLTDRLTLGTGLRYYLDYQQYASGSDIQSGNFHSLDPRFYAQYKLTDQANVYASAAKGFRTGGFNQENQPKYDPEVVWTYELGTKTLFAEGRVSADLAAFYSKYTNYQIIEDLPPPALPIDITANAGDAKIEGIEWELAWRPGDPWTLNLNGDYLHTAFTSINQLLINGIPTSGFNVGDPLDFVLKYEYTLSAQRDFDWDGKRGFTRLDFNQRGREILRNRSIGPWYYDESDTIRMLNFNMGLQYSESLSLGLFAQNLLNDRGFTDAMGLERFGARSRPRTFGVNFAVKFD